MKSRKIASLRCVAVAAPSYVAERGRPESPADLARHACIIRTSAQDARAWTFQARDGTPLRIPVQGVFEADNAYVTMHAVLSGMGIAVMPFYHAREAVETTSHWHRLQLMRYGRLVHAHRRGCDGSSISWSNGSRRKSSEESGEELEPRFTGARGHGAAAAFEDAVATAACSMMLVTSAGRDKKGT
jgi:DNA-binding transcriptional LysR family regulator